MPQWTENTGLHSIGTREMFTYVGTFDDQVRAYSWSSIRINEDVLNATLFRPIVFPEERLIVNDGYILQSETLLRQLLDPNSLLRFLLDNDIVKIMSRGNPLHAIIDDRINSGVTSFKKYENIWRGYKVELEDLHTQRPELWPRWSIRPPERHLGAAFCEMMKRIYEEQDPKDLFGRATETYGNLPRLYKPELFTLVLN